MVSTTRLAAVVTLLLSSVAGVVRPAPAGAAPTRGPQPQTPTSSARTVAGPVAAARPASVSSAPCSFYGSGSCQSTSAVVTLYLNTTFLAGFCTVNIGIDWGDGSTKNSVVTAVFGEFAVNIGSHTYATTGGYSIPVTTSVQSGSCVFPSYLAQYTYVPIGSSSLKSPNVQGGGSPDLLPTTCSCGAPVNTDTGELWHTFTDLAVPGRGLPLDLTRTYSSASASTLGPLGYGWTDPYAMALTFDGSGNAIVHDGNSSSVTALVSGSNYTFPTDVLATLVKNADGTFTYTRKDRSAYGFSAAGTLTKETDRNGYVTTLAHNASGRLTSVTDPEGRALRFAYTAGGLVYSVTDPVGRRVKFAYDASNNLVKTTDVGGKSWAFAYDSNHLLLKMTDPRGGVTTNTYDGSGRVLTQADPVGRTTTYAYSGTAGSGSGTTTVTDPRGEVTNFVYANNELTSATYGFGTPAQATWKYAYDPSVLGKTSVTDPKGHITTSTYDASGNRLRTTDPLGRVATATYNSFNEPLSVTDPKGVTTTFAYNASGNLLSQTTGTQTTAFAYADATHPGDVTSATDPDGKTTAYAYDGNGDDISVTDALGHTSTATYDGIGRVLTVTRPNGGVTTRTYDAFGDVLTATNPLGDTTTNTFDADQNLVTTTDPLGHTTKYVFDADNEPTATIRPGKLSTATAYDADGNVTSTTDAAGHVTTNTYDPLNRLASSTDPLGHLTSNTYDLAGNRTTQTNPSGKTTSDVYDADNEVTSQTYSDGVTHAVTFAYDSDRRRTSMTDGTGTTTYTYDSLGRLTASTNGAGQSTAYGYDAKNQLTSLTYPNGHSVTRAYDAVGNLTSVTDWLGNTTTFTYDADRNLQTQSVPSTPAVTDTTAYDAGDQIASITDIAATTTLQGFTYTRNADALVASVTPSGQASGAYSYDALNRLTQDAQGKYAYTADGSVTTLLRTRAMTYNAADQLTSSVTAGHTTSYTYDAQGDRVAATPPTGAPTTFAFDQAGDMTGFGQGATTASYAYNGDGLRMSKTVNGIVTAFSWDMRSGVPLLLSDGTASYVYGPGGLPLEQITTTGVLYYHHDQLGSTTMLTDPTGASVATYTYDSYGHLSSSTGSASNPLLFAGQYLDGESGLYYLQARYYDPRTGQFARVDPAISVTGAPYAYTGGDPVNGDDPTGLAYFAGVCAGGAGSLAHWSAQGESCFLASRLGLANTVTPGIGSGIGGDPLVGTLGFAFGSAKDLDALGGYSKNVSANLALWGRGFYASYSWSPDGGWSFEAGLATGLGAGISGAGQYTFVNAASSWSQIGDDYAWAAQQGWDDLVTMARRAWSSMWSAMTSTGGCESYGN